MAAMVGNVDVVKYLLEHGAQVDVKDKVRKDINNMTYIYRLSLCVVVRRYSFQYNVDGIIGQTVTAL
jgi:UDP-glucose 6-dehydrogenase